MQNFELEEQEKSHLLIKNTSINSKTLIRPPNFKKVLRQLLKHFGPQNWWPGDTPFEICVGAILTQNTAWTNVEKAIQNLKAHRCLTPKKLYRLSLSNVAQRIKPSGFFNLKAKRLKAFLKFLKNKFHFSVHLMKSYSTPWLRTQLLAVYGIGKETADSILLYALQKPIFVIDAYTYRIFTRHGWIHGNEDYDEIRKLIEKTWGNSTIKKRIQDFNEFHALLVAVGKNYCTTQNPQCSKCPLVNMLQRNLVDQSYQNMLR